MPPSRQSTSASSRNCSRMWWRFAPIALQMPISRVRSVTDTSMMFMIPMPPTSSEMLTMLVITIVTVVRIELKVSCSCWAV